ncbi:hypothetical protein CUMW_160730 [Citrus unshiu]|nr:hypothetical protein CUMW_160730 [Citrus unshiu]
MKFTTHTGTHVDAPGHFFDHYFDAGFDVDSLDLDVLNGQFYICSSWLLVDVPRDKNLTAYVHKVRHKLCGIYGRWAKWLVENTDIKLVGVDYLSVAAFDDIISAHHELLRNRVRKSF